MLLRTLLLLALGSCTILEKNTLDPEFFGEKCIYKIYKPVEENKCPYMLIPFNSAQKKFEYTRQNTH